VIFDEQGSNQEGKDLLEDQGVLTRSMV